MLLPLLIKSALGHSDEDFRFEGESSLLIHLYAVSIGIPFFLLCIGCRFYIGDYFDRPAKIVKKNNNTFYDLRG